MSTAAEKNQAAQAEKDARRQRAESFRLMMELSAWKEVMAILSEIEEGATKDEDMVPMEDLSVARIAECRGRRRAIDLIHRRIDFIVNGPR